MALAQVYKRVGKSVIWVCENDPKGLADKFYGFLERENILFFVIDSYLKDSDLQQLNWDAKF